MFFFAVFVVLWVWFLPDFRTKKTKPGRQGDRETGRQGDRETRRRGERETWRQGDRGTRTLYRQRLHRIDLVLTMSTMTATIHIEAYMDSLMTNPA